MKKIIKQKKCLLFFKLSGGIQLDSKVLKTTVNIFILIINQWIK